MSTAGPNYPGTTADDATVGATSWTAVSAVMVDDGGYATASMGPSGNSHYIKATNFNFALPQSVITNILLEVERKSSVSSITSDFAVRQVKAGTIGSVDFSNGSTWPTSDGVQTYSGLFEGSWLYTDINDSGFGFAFAAQNAAGSGATASVDYMRVTVTYTIVSATLTGTAIETASSVLRESGVVAGGKTIVITLSGDTWVAAGATFDAQRQNIIDGIDSAQSEANGWDATVKATQGVAGVVRTSDTVVTITLDAQASYAITANETITATIPATALTGASAIVATPTFRVVDDRPRTPNLLGGLGIGREPPPRNMGDVRAGIVPLHWKDTRPR